MHFIMYGRGNLGTGKRNALQIYVSQKNGGWASLSHLASGMAWLCRGPKSICLLRIKFHPPLGTEPCPLSYTQPCKMGAVRSLPSSDPAGSKETTRHPPVSDSEGENVQTFTVPPHPLSSSPHLLSHSLSFSVWGENDKNASS